MANQRRAGQIFIGFQTDKTLLGMLDAGRARDSRSLFVRRAVAEKLRGLGFTVSDELIYGPDRAGRDYSDTEPRPGVQKESPETVSVDFPLRGHRVTLNEPDAGEERAALPPRKRVSYRDALKKERPKKRA